MEKSYSDQKSQHREVTDIQGRFICNDRNKESMLGHTFYNTLEELDFTLGNSGLISYLKV